MPKKGNQKNTNKKSSSGSKKSPQKLLKTFTKRAGGSGITQQQAQRAVEKKGINPQRVLNIDKKRSDVTLSPEAKKYLKGAKKDKGKETSSQAGTSPAAGGGTGVFQDEGTGIFGPISAHEKDIANIYADADKYIADASAGAQIRGAELGLEGTKYAADKEAAWREAVAGIEVKGRLDLQPIINAGLEKVAGIEAQASRDVADITGKYGVEGIKTKGEFDEKIGRINLAGSMYNLIGSAFG